MVNDENTSGETLLSVIESIIRSDTEIIAEVERLKAKGADKSVAEIASEIIVMYSNRSAISGGRLRSQPSSQVGVHLSQWWAVHFSTRHRF